MPIKILALILGFILLFTMITLAGGYVKIEYDTMSGLAMTEVNVYEDLGVLRLGIQMNTYLMEMALKDNWLPAGVPESQYYRGYLDLKISEDVTITLASQCRHFFSQSHIDFWNDTSSITVGAKYEF